MIKRSYFILFCFLLVVIIAACLFGCTTAKDNKAVARVISKQDLSNRVFDILSKQHPCNTDSVFIPGNEVIVYDTTQVDHTDTLVVDSVHQVIITKWRTNTITKIVHKIDTIRLTSERDYRMCNDSLQATRGRYQEIQNRYQDEKKTASKRLWWIVGLILLIGAGVFLKIKRII